MNPRPKAFHLPLALALIPTGGLIILFGKFGAVTDSPGLNLLLWIAGFLLWMWGCFHMVVARGLPASYGFLGLFFIVGLGIIFWLATKQPQIARAAARRKAENPDSKYKGDPTSLY